MILILAPHNDMHAVLVRDALRERGEDCRIFDTSELGAGAELSVRVGSTTTVIWRPLLGDALRLGAGDCIWFRRLNPPRTPRSRMTNAEWTFVLREWQELVLAALVHGEAPVVNAPRAQLCCPKPLQLHLARECGLRVPETVVTNARHDVDALTERVAKLVHKPLTAPTDRNGFTRRLSAEDVQALDALEHAPVIFQEAVTGRTELRVLVAGSRVLAGAFTPDPRFIDARQCVDADYTLFELPAAVSRALCDLTRALGLTMGLVDMRLDVNGDPVFLEINPQGQFLYVEIMGGLPLVEAVADHLQAVARGGAT